MRAFGRIEPWLARTIGNLFLLKWLVRGKTSLPAPGSDHLLELQMVLTGADARRLDLLERLSVT